MSEEAQQIDAGSEIAHTPPGGLLAGIKREPAQQPTQQPVDLPSQHQDQWFWDEGVPGTGPKPAWLKEKYGNIAQQAKAYVEAEKQLGQLSGAPDQYDLSAYEDKIDVSDSYMQRFIETAKKSRMSQEGFTEMVNTLIEYETSKMPNIDAEIAKLGPNARERIETVKRWASNNLSQEACDVLGQIGNRAEVINFIDEIRQLSIHQASQPPGAQEPSEAFVKLTLEDIDEELKVPANAQRYLNDAKYRAEIQRKYKLVLGEE